MKRVFLALPLISMLALTGCSNLVASTVSLTDDRIKNVTSGAIGVQPNDVTITSRRTEGSNTYVNLMTYPGKKEYTCIINGGSLLDFGLLNPPQCAIKGQGVNGSMFH